MGNKPVNFSSSNTVHILYRKALTSLCKLIHDSVCDGYSEQFNGGLIKHAKQKFLQEFLTVLKLALGVFEEAQNQYKNKKSSIYRSKFHTSKISDID